MMIFRAVDGSIDRTKSRPLAMNRIFLPEQFIVSSQQRGEGDKVQLIIGADDDGFGFKRQSFFQRLPELFDGTSAATIKVCSSADS